MQLAQIASLQCFTTQQTTFARLVRKETVKVVFNAGWTAKLVKSATLLLF